MASVRSFVAIELAEHLLREVARIQLALQTAIASPVSWINPEGIHLTLQFLGNMPEDRFGEIRTGLVAMAARHRPFEIALGDLGAFPNEAHPRMLWAGLHGDLDTLAGLQRSVQMALAP